ncbi:MAG: copper amine oxidase N-terminal domain-containing protein [Syntrophomonadaceae bacterium]|nr:copper amine oxidase N-terminal domain-containing protein [Syntrophomonadaceae bacterium]
MLKRNKAISIVLAFVFCITFLAPALIAPATAEASSDYKVEKAPVVKTIDGSQNLGIVKVTISDTNLAAYDMVTVSLPSDLDLGSNVTVVNKVNNDGGIQILATGNGDCLSVGAFKTNENKQIAIKNNNFDIVMADSILTNGDTSDQFFYIYFNGIDLNNTTGDITVDFRAPRNSSFSSSNDIVIAKSSSSGSTTTLVKKVEDVPDKGGKIATLTIEEDAANSFDFSESNFKLEILTKGFSWKKTGTMSYEWEFSKFATTAAQADKVDGSNSENLYFAVPDSFAYEGEVLRSFENPGKFTFEDLQIVVNDTKANVGDEIEIKISGYSMDKATVVVGKYVDYDVAVEEGTTKTLIAGQEKQSLGEFYITEGAAGSLVEGRTIKFTLPSGVEWYDKNAKKDDVKVKDPDWDYEVVNSSDIDFKDDDQISGDNDEVLKITIDTDTDKKGAKIKFKDLKVNVSPAFKGDIELEVSGSAGAQGTIKVAEVVPAATISVEKVNNLILGKPNQKLSDITITEGDVEGLLEGSLVLKLDRDYRFAKEPTVKVVEGDIDIDEDATIDDETLTIEVKGQSNKTASKILISDIYVDAYRTAPEGPVSITFGDLKNDLCDALNEVVSFNGKKPGKAVVANCVTAAMGETMGNGQFVIGSNVYELNGVKKVMDCAPYIKGDRTYVPVRYLAYVLGMTEDDVVWDQASQKVTLTKGDNVVELTIGSTTLYVNGEAQTMDVAPEINLDRTMLPARYVAEGFGFVVGWDAFSSTVLITK